jgi:Tfp pilus assembly protein PilN
MIEINLYPEDLKAKAKEKNIFAGLDLKKLIYVIPAALAILISLHLLLLIAGIVRSSQLGSLEKKWQSLEPQRKLLDEFNKEYYAYTQDAALIKQLTEERINWPEKLNRLSLGLPSGIWLTDISINSKELNLRGSVVSPEKLEMSLINKFIDTLKNDSAFFKDFTALALGPMQSRVVSEYDVTDFNLKGTLKGK